MRTAGIIVTLVAALASPAAAQEQTLEQLARKTLAGLEQLEREIAREVQREAEQAEREQERLARERQRIERDRQRAKEQGERVRERMREQAERQRARDGRAEEVERTTRTLRIGGSGELHLSNIAGDITVSRGGGNEAHVEIVKTARAATSEEARELLKLVEIEIAERANRAEISTHFVPGDAPRKMTHRGINVSVAFNVTVPAATRVRVNSISGEVSARDIAADVVLKSVSGTVRLANGGGSCSAESISGDVEIIDSAFDGAVSASSASGNILLRRVKARRIAVGSVSGNVTLTDTSGTAVEAKSVSGNVELAGGLVKSSRYELGTHSGTLNVTVSGGTGFEVQATSFSGTVQADVPFTDRAAEPSRARFNRSLRGVVGDGSALISLSTFSGSIVITRR